MSAREDTTPVLDALRAGEIGDVEALMLAWRMGHRQGEKDTLRLDIPSVGEISREPSPFWESKGGITPAEANARPLSAILGAGAIKNPDWNPPV